MCPMLLCDVIEKCLQSLLLISASGAWSNSALTAQERHASTGKAVEFPACNQSHNLLK